MPVPLPSRPRHPLPSGACDCHAHVFGPYDRFPLPAQRSYDPPLAAADDYLAMLERVGLSRGVLVQPSAYGTDCAAVLDALGRAPGRLRGVAAKDRSVTDAELARMHALGVRALRFTEAAGQGGRLAGAIGFGELAALAPRLRELGCHAQLFAPCDAIAAALPQLLPLGLPLVLDHLGLAGAAGYGLDAPPVQALLAGLRDGGVWMKLPLIRNSQLYPGYADLRALHDAYVAANPDRLLWGSDWPYVHMDGPMPDVGLLLDRLADWTDEQLRRKILVDNPAALYGFAP